jgi:N-acetylmuramoyl-L-alanine amidase
MNEQVFFIDAGHGGIINGHYETSPNKMHRFPDGIFSFEGVINRWFKDELFQQMDMEGYRYIDVSPSNLDISLSTRVKIINNLYIEYPKAVLISIHNNASPKHNASGSEVWTTKGLTKSDYHTDIYAPAFKKAFPEISFRGGKKKGSFDKESMFYIIKETDCPAFLIEILFFDSWTDYLKLTDPVFRYDWARKVMIPYMERAVLTEGIW